MGNNLDRLNKIFYLSSYIIPAILVPIFAALFVRNRKGSTYAFIGKVTLLSVASNLGTLSRQVVRVTGRTTTEKQR